MPRVVSRVNSLVGDLLAAVLPLRCPGCGRSGPAGAPLCPECASALRPAPAAPPPPGVDWWVSCFAYEGVTREVIAAAKYRNERAALGDLAQPVANAVRERAPTRVDIVTWPPASRARYSRAGIDHAAMIARVVAREINAPARVLSRRGDNIAQTGRDASSRRQGPHLVGTRSLRDLEGGSTVLVVDDVATTGGTLAAVARVLLEGGARRVYAATIARTPRPGGFSPIRAYTPAVTAV